MNGPRDRNNRRRGTRLEPSPTGRHDRPAGRTPAPPDQPGQPNPGAGGGGGPVGDGVPARPGGPTEPAPAPGHTNAPDGQTRPAPAVPAPRLHPPDPTPTGDRRLAVTVEVRLVDEDRAPGLAAQQLVAITEVLQWLRQHYPPT